MPLSFSDLRGIKKDTESKLSVSGTSYVTRGTTRIIRLCRGPLIVSLTRKDVETY